jgi:hypothetical protein
MRHSITESDEDTDTGLSKCRQNLWYKLKNSDSESSFGPTNHGDGDKEVPDHDIEDDDVNQPQSDEDLNSDDTHTE